MRRSRGFTLIEVMVAAAVLGMAATALFALLSKSLSNLSTIENLHHYQLASQDIMNRVLLLANLPPGGTIEGNLEKLDGRYKVTLTPWMPTHFDGGPSEVVMKVDVEVFWPGRSGERVLKIETIKTTPVYYQDYDYKNAIETSLPQ